MNTHTGSLGTERLSPVAISAFFVAHSCALGVANVSAAAARCETLIPGPKRNIVHLSCSVLFDHYLWVGLLCLPLVVTLAGSILTIRNRDCCFVEKAFTLGIVLGVILPLPLSVLQ
jgi:hypothetical protein